MERVRADRWLWAARFFKTRSLSTDAIDAGRVRVNGERIKPAKDLKVGDTVTVNVSSLEYVVKVKGLSDKRGSATIAQTLYDETEESRLRREELQQKRQRFADPAEKIFARPTKRDRRQLDRLRGD